PIPRELTDPIAAGFVLKTSAIRPGCRVVKAATGECVIGTAPQPWAYSAEFSIDIPAARQGPGFIRAEILVTRGPIGIGILNRAASDFLFRIPVTESPEPQTIDIPVSD